MVNENMIEIISFYTSRNIDVRFMLWTETNQHVADFSVLSDGFFASRRIADGSLGALLHRVDRRRHFIVDDLLGELKRAIKDGKGNQGRTNAQKA